MSPGPWAARGWRSFLDRNAADVIGILFTGFLLLLLVTVEQRLLELTASWGDKGKVTVRLTNAFAAAQAVADAARDQAGQFDDPAELRDAISSTSAAIDAIAETFVLSGPRVPAVASELALWPFTATALPEPNGGVRLNLVSVGAVDEAMEPIDVMCVVKDSRERTFTREARLNEVIKRQVASFHWPDDFTSGDFAVGEHCVDWSIAPISVGRRRRFQHVAQAPFNYRR